MQQNQSVSSVAQSCLTFCDPIDCSFFCDFPGGSEVKASAWNAGDLGSIPGSGRSPGEGNGNQLQFSCLENPMDGGAWWATVHGSQSRTRLSDFTLLCLPQRLWSEKAMAPHSSTLAWKIPWMEEPGRLQSMGSLRVGHD